MSNQQDRALEELRLVSSLSFFRSHPISSFSIQFQQAIRQVLQLSCTRHQGLYQYSLSNFSNHLHENIPWTELCEDYDKLMERRPLEEENDQPTALGTILKLLDNPLLLPCLPRRMDLPNIFLSNIVHAAPSQWNRLVSALDILVSHLPSLRGSILKTLLQMIQRLDQKDIVIDKDNRKPNQNDAKLFSRKRRRQHSTSVDRHSCSVSTARRPKLASLEDLHESPGLTTLPHYQQLRHVPRQWTLQKILRTQDENDHDDESQHSCLTQSPWVKSHLSSSWRGARLRAYHKLKSILFLQQPQHKSFLQNFSGPATEMDTLLFLAVQGDRNMGEASSSTTMATMTMTTTTFRLALLYLAEPPTGSKKDSYYSYISQRCWKQYNGSGNSKWLRIASELWVEAAFFDDRRECWKMVEALCKQLVATNEENGSSPNGQSEQDTTNLDPNLFRCLAYVLTYRYRIFRSKNDSIRASFDNYLSLLSVRFGEVHYWMDPSVVNIKEQLRTIQMLRKTNIVSYFDLQQFGAVGSNDSAPKQCSQNWPFEEPNDLRSAMIRLLQPPIERSHRNEWIGLFSNPNHDKEITLDESRQSSKPCKSNRIASAASVQRVLNNPDVLHSIFSYCDYHPLFQMRSVCKMMQAIIDDPNQSRIFWHRIYKFHYGNKMQGEAVHAYENLQHQHDWKVLFQNKFLTERSIRHQRHIGSGWKYQTCGYLGCLRILRSPLLLQKHYESHARKATKQVRKKRKTASAKKAES